jgi:hypothetical protein
MSDFTLIKSLVDLGCTVVICSIIVIVLYKLSMKFGVAFLATQEKIAEAMAQQAQSLCGVNTAIQTYIQRDNTEHREILLAVQVMGEHLKWLRDEVKGISAVPEDMKKAIEALHNEVKAIKAGGAAGQGG